MSKLRPAPGPATSAPTARRNADAKPDDKSEQAPATDTSWSPGRRNASLGDDPAVQRAFTAAKTLEDVKNGVEARYIQLNALDREVANLEAKLGTQLQNLSPALTQEDRQRFADTFREQHASAYQEAREAAEGLAQFLCDNVSRTQQATTDLKHHPFRSGVAGLPMRLSAAIDQAASSLDRHTHLSPQGDKVLEHSLCVLGRGFAKMAADAGRGDEDARHGNAVKNTATTSEGALSRLAKFGGRFSEIAEHSANAFGVVAGAIGGVENLHRLANGEGRVEHGVGLAANSAEIVGGALAIGGVAVGATLGLGGMVVALGAEAVSAYRDRQEYVRDTTATLKAIGLNEPHAAGLAASNPEALRALATAGWSATQISRFVANAPGMVRAHHSQAHAVVNAARVFNLPTDRLVELTQELGSPGADVALSSLTRVIAASPGASRQQILRMMENGFEANDFARQLARRLGAG